MSCAAKAAAVKDWSITLSGSGDDGNEGEDGKGDDSGEDDDDGAIRCGVGDSGVSGRIGWCCRRSGALGGGGRLATMLRRPSKKLLRLALDP